MNQASEKLADDFLKNPVTVSVKKTDVTQNIEQTIVHYQNNNKFDTLLDLLKDKDFKRVLVFGSRKHSAQKLAEQLNDNKIPTESIHGNKSLLVQPQNSSVCELFFLSPFKTSFVPRRLNQDPPFVSMKSR